MTEIVIRGVNLGKRYLIGERERYLALRDLMANALKAPVRLFGKTKNSRNHEREHIWALKHVSFEIREGEVVGIIGRNGVGKTTLLKILARVTKPTEGYAEVCGRIGSLLEVGTGFHPELTGRENVSLSGAILGMSRKEIVRKFDEIVAFAEVEKFIDTPLKHYSTGMQMRLAFAVAAHLEPEILLVDEILAVGDVAFQKKCLGKMSHVARTGRTILFVSHQMNQVRRLCERVIWIDDGQIHRDGTAGEVVSAYEAALSSANLESRTTKSNRNVKGRFLGWQILDQEKGWGNAVHSHGPVAVRFVLECSAAIDNGHHGISLFSGDGQLIWGTAVDHLSVPPGRHQLVYQLPSLPVRPGLYRWRVSLYDERGLVDVLDCVPELLVDTQPMTHPRDEWAGVLNLPYEFSLTDSEPGEGHGV